MSKATSALVSICGIILFLIGLAFICGILASNMLMIRQNDWLVQALS